MFSKEPPLHPYPIYRLWTLFIFPLLLRNPPSRSMVSHIDCFRTVWLPLFLVFKGYSLSDVIRRFRFGVIGRKSQSPTPDGSYSYQKRLVFRRRGLSWPSTSDWLSTFNTTSCRSRRYFSLSSSWKGSDGVCIFDFTMTFIQKLFHQSKKQSFSYIIHTYL